MTIFANAYQFGRELEPYRHSIRIRKDQETSTWEAKYNFSRFMTFILLSSIQDGEYLTEDALSLLLVQFKDENEKRCFGKTSKGGRCKIITTGGQTFCHRHKASQIAHEDALAARSLSLDSMKNNGLIRNILSVIEIPTSVRWSRMKGIDKNVASQELIFLSDLCSKIEERENGNYEINRIIAKDELSRIHKSFLNLYSDFPTLEMLISSEILKEHSSKDEFLVVNLFSKFWRELGDLVSANLWQHLLEVDTIEDTELVLKWLFFVREIQSYSSSLKYMTDDARRRFLDATCKVLLAQSDIIGWDFEIQKVRLEQHTTYEDAMRYGREIPIPGEDSSLLENYFCYEIIDARIPVSQSSRQHLSKLIFALVSFDDGDGVSYQARYSRILSVVNNSINRPYILKIASEYIVRHRPSVIAYLLINEKTAPLGLRLLDRVYTDRDRFPLLQELYSISDSVELKKAFWSSGLKLVMTLSKERLYLRDGINKEIATLLSEIVMLISKNYEDQLSSLISYQANSSHSLLEYRTESHNLITSTSFADGSSLDLVIKPIICQLAELIIFASMREFCENERRVDKSYYWSLFWLLSVTNKLLRANNNLLSSKDRISFEKVRREVSLSICTLYRESLSFDSINFWYFKDELLSDLEWTELYITLFDLGEHELLLDPVDFVGKFCGISSILSSLILEWQSKYSSSFEHNVSIHSIERTLLIKYRLHLRILTSIFQQLETSEILLTCVTQSRRQELREVLEDSIIKFLFVQNIKPNNVDNLEILFQYELEYPRMANEWVPLLPDITDILGSFSLNKISTHITRFSKSSNDLYVLLLLRYHFRNSNDRIVNQLNDKLETLDVPNYFKNQFYVVDKAKDIINKSLEAGLTGLAREVLNVINALNLKSGSLRDSWDEFNYKSSLTLAYHDNDIATLKDVPIPNQQLALIPLQQVLRKGIYTTAFLDSQKHYISKYFFLGLAYLQSNSKEAHSIFDSLYSFDKTNFSYAINRFAASLYIASAEKDPETKELIYQNALVEWSNSIESIPSTSLKFIESQILYNKLTAYVGIDSIQLFETEWWNAPIKFRAQQPYVELAITFFISSGFESKAESVVSEAKSYHLKAGMLPEWLKLLLQRVVGGTLGQVTTTLAYDYTVNYELLANFRSQFLEIKELNASALSHIVSRDPLDIFLVNTIIACCSELIDRSTLLDGAEEDVKNDWLTSLLRCRVAAWNWQVSDQSRGGASESGNSPGERDLMIRDRNGFPLCVLEAFRLKYLNTTTIKQHLTKLFKYDPNSMQQGFIIVYSEVPNFLELWDKYLNNFGTVTFTNWIPASSELTVVESYSKVIYGHNMKVAMVTHVRGDDEITVYHIFLNMHCD